MGIPNYNEIYHPLLEYLVDAPDVVRRVVLCEELAKRLNITEAEQEERLKSGERRFRNRVDWAVMSLKQAGFLESPRRGCYKVTPIGREEFRRGTEINYNYLFKKYIKKSNDNVAENLGQAEEVASPEVTDEGGNGTPDEEVESLLQRIDDALAVDLLERTYEIGDKRFEQLAVDLLVKMGYGKNGKRTGGPGDGGIDGIIYEDELGFVQVGIQAKCNAEDNKVGGGDISKFSGALDRRGLQKGVFITTSSFTRDAQTAAQEVTKSIITINGRQLANLMIKHGVGCKGETLIKNTVDKNFWQSDEE